MAPQTLARVSFHRNCLPMSSAGQGALLSASCVPAWDFPLLSSFAFLVSFVSFYDGRLEPRVGRRCLNVNPGLCPWLRTDEDSVLFIQPMFAEHPAEARVCPFPSRSATVWPTFCVVVTRNFPPSSVQQSISGAGTVAAKGSTKTGKSHSLSWRSSWSRRRLNQNGQ